MITDLFGIDLAIIQAPMAGSRGSTLAIAVSNAGGLGSQPCAMLAPDGIRRELQAIAASTSKPMWAGQRAALCRELPAAELTRALAAGDASA